MGKMSDKSTWKNKGKSRARRFIDTVDTSTSKFDKQNKDMVRDAKTGKEMTYRQFRELQTKQEIDEDRKRWPFSPVSTQTRKRMERAKPRIEDRSVFDHQTKGKPIKKLVGNVKRAMGMSGLKYGGQPKKPYGMKSGGLVCRGMGKASRGGKYKAT